MALSSKSMRYESTTFLSTAFSCQGICDTAKRTADNSNTNVVHLQRDDNLYIVLFLLHKGHLTMRLLAEQCNTWLNRDAVPSTQDCMPLIQHKSQYDV